MKHKNGKIDGTNTVTTVSLTRDEAEKLINGLFKHKDIKPVFISDYDRFHCGFEFLMQELRNWRKKSASEKDDLLIKSCNSLYPLSFSCEDIKKDNTTKSNINGKIYEGYFYDSTVKYIFEGTITSRMGKTHNVRIQYNPHLTVHFVPCDAAVDEDSHAVKYVIYKCLFFYNSYKLKVTVDDNILYTRNGEIDENFQAEIDDKIKKHIENTTLEILEGTIEGIQWE